MSQDHLPSLRALRSTAPALVRLREPVDDESLALFWQDLLSFCAGDRDWRDVIGELCDAHALRDALLLAREHDRGQEEEVWERFRQSLRDLDSMGEAARCRDDLERLVQEGADDAGLEAARARVEALATAAKDLETWDRDDLAGAHQEPLRALMRLREETQFEVELARETLERRQREIRERVERWRREAGDLVAEMMREELYDEIVPRLRRMRAAVKVARGSDLELLLTNLRRLRDLDFSAAAEFEDPAAPQVVTAHPALLPPQVEQGQGRPIDLGSRGAPLSWDQLTPWVQEELAQPVGGQPSREALSEEELQQPPSLVWDRSVLKARAELARRAIGRSVDAPALGVWLVEQAKLALLERQFRRATVLFGDGFRWACQPRVVHGPGMDVWRQECGWGLLLALLLPYELASLSTEDARAILEGRNLSLLMHRRPGDVPFALFARRGLLPELGARLLALQSAGQVFLRELLAPWLLRAQHAVPDLIAGMLSESRPSGGALRLVAELCDLLEVEPTVGARLRAAAERAREGGARALDRLRRELEPYDAQGPVGAVLEALRLILEAAPTQESFDLSHQLLSDGLEARAGARLVVEVRRSQMGAVYGVQPRPTLVGEDGIPVQKRAFGDVSPLPPLASGSAQELVLTCALDALRAGDTARLDLRYELDEGDGRVKRLSTRVESFSVPLRRVLVHRQEPANPYVVGRALEDLGHVLGRDQQIKEIQRALVGSAQDNAVLVLGDRRIGKTSLLNALRQAPEIHSRYIAVLIDLQSLDRGASPTSFFLDVLAAPVQRELARKDLRLSLPDPAVFGRNPFESFKGLIRDWDRALAERGRRVLILLDEMERLFSLVDLAERGGPGGLPEEVVATLRAVMLSARQISFVMAGVTDVLRRHTSSRKDRLFKLAVEIELATLPEDAARELVEGRPKGVFQVTRSASDRILRETGRQPYLLQYVCRELFEHVLKDRHRLACVADVEQVFANSVVSRTPAFAYLMDALQDPEDLLVARALAVLQAGNRYVSVRDIARQTARLGSPRDPDALQERLRDLAGLRLRTIFEERIGRKDQYRLSIGLFARHLRTQGERGLSLLAR